MAKVIYIDTETTGTDKSKHDITQVSGIIEIDGKEVERFNLFCKPFSFENIDPEALQVTGKTVEELKAYPDPKDTYRKFVGILDQYVDKYNKGDKFYVAGQNVRFDLEFLHSWSNKCGDKYLGSYLLWHVIDLYVFTAAARAWGMLSFDSLKLTDVCKTLNFSLENAHDALADIEATMKCIKYFQKIFLGAQPPNTI